jgi:hypothetical protein
MSRALASFGVALIAATATACVSTVAVPLRDGVFPRGAIQVGEDVRLTTRAGESLAFEVAGVEDGTLTGSEGERVAAGDLTSLEVKRFNKRATIVAASVIGGVIATVLVSDSLDDDYCESFNDCDF